MQQVLDRFKPNQLHRGTIHECSIRQIIVDFLSWERLFHDCSVSVVDAKDKAHWLFWFEHLALSVKTTRNHGSTLSLSILDPWHIFTLLEIFYVEPTGSGRLRCDRGADGDIIWESLHSSFVHYLCCAFLLSTTFSDTRPLAEKLTSCVCTLSLKMTRKRHETAAASLWVKEDNGTCKTTRTESPVWCIIRQVHSYGKPATLPLRGKVWVRPPNSIVWWLFTPALQATFFSCHSHHGILTCFMDLQVHFR